MLLSSFDVRYLQLRVGWLNVVLNSGWSMTSSWQGPPLGYRVVLKQYNALRVRT